MLSRGKYTICHTSRWRLVASEAAEAAASYREAETQVIININTADCFLEMRLINLQTLALEEYNEKDVPSYAILSHTWDKEEVTFADWNTDDHGAHLAGYSKIAGFISTARKLYDSSYGWVDTCCIDKSSSAELTEAINSMFRYYSNATVCIVHLADVADDVDTNTSSDVEAAVCQARWLSRGWYVDSLLGPAGLYN